MRLEFGLVAKGGLEGQQIATRSHRNVAHARLETGRCRQWCAWMALIPKCTTRPVVLSLPQAREVSGETIWGGRTAQVDANLLDRHAYRFLPLQQQQTQ